MKKILFLTGILTLMINAGCLVRESGGHSHYRGHDHYEGPSAVVVAPPVVIVRPPEIIIH